MTDPDKRIYQMLSKLRARNFRITPQRLAVLKILALSKDHPSVEQIYDQVKADFPTTSLATIYKTVILLKEMEQILELGFSNESSRYDGNRPYPHPHIICIKCKRIVDPEVAVLTELPLEMEQKTGYKIVNHRLDFFGICPLCQDKD